MSNMILICSLLLVLCKIETFFALPTDWNVPNSVPVEIYRVHNTNRALSDLQGAKKCKGTQYNLYVPPGGVKFFWSGFGVDNSDKAAAEIAEYVGKQEGKKTWTLETILQLEQNRHIPTCKWTIPPDPVCEQFWNDISCEYAKKARGDIRFILGPNLNPTGNWMRVESGQIRDNQQSGQDVYGFKKYDLHTTYCGQMANYQSQYPNVRAKICG